MGCDMFVVMGCDMYVVMGCDMYVNIGCDMYFLVVFNFCSVEAMFVEIAKCWVIQWCLEVLTIRILVNVSFVQLCDFVELKLLLYTRYVPLWCVIILRWHVCVCICACVCTLYMSLEVINCNLAVYVHCALELSEASVKTGRYARMLCMPDTDNYRCTFSDKDSSTHTHVWTGPHRAFVSNELFCQKLLLAPSS